MIKCTCAFPCGGTTPGCCTAPKRKTDTDTGPVTSMAKTKHIDDLEATVVQLHQELTFMLEQSMIVEYMQDSSKIRKLRKKYGIGW